MGIKFNPGLKAAGIDPSMVDNLIEAQKIPLKNAEARKEKIIVEKEEVDKLQKMLSDLDSALNGLKTRTDFYKLKLDSSHPDIIDGTVSPGAMLGTYEFEVRAMAKADKDLAFGFPDKDKTPIGFGYMTIARDDGEEVEIEVEPGTTLQQLTNQINDAGAGVRAMVINTKYYPDSYRLLVVSEKSGKDAKIFIDEDTTYLEFKEQVVGRNLDVLFEDVPVTDETNVLNELIDGVSLTVRRSEPGTRVQVTIANDIDATVAGIKAFVEKYNEISTFINSQYQKDPKTGEYGLLASDSGIKYVMRQMQSALSSLPKVGEKYSTLAQIGITSDPKSGNLMMDEAKVKTALAEDYDSVAQLFIRGKDSVGVAENLAQRLKNFRDPGSGVVKSRMRGLDRMIKNQDEEIERRTRQLDDKEKSIRRQFTNLESQLGSLQSQSSFLKAKLGGGGGES